MKEEKYIGLIEDPRAEIDKSTDYKHEELFGSSDISWLTKKEADKSESLFPIRDQKNTSACVCYATVTALYNSEKEILSPGFLYTQRINKPNEGCYYYDIANLVVKQGVSKESILETPLKEQLVNNLKITDKAKQDALEHKQKSYIFLDDPTIDQLADLSNKGIAVLVSIFSNREEWATDYPTMKDPKMTQPEAPINHAITVLPNTGFKLGGIKHVKIQDSAHFGNIVFRDLSESWVKTRVKHAMYFIDLEKVPSDFPQELRGFTWNKDLSVGSRGLDVENLQKFLTHKGFFPKVQKPTGYFGGITKKAVSDYQISKGIKPSVGYFGPITRTEMNKETY